MIMITTATTTSKSTSLDTVSGAKYVYYAHHTRNVLLWDVSLCLSAAVLTAVQCTTTEDQLLDYLFKDSRYNPAARPVIRARDSVQVNMSLGIDSIDELVGGILNKKNIRT